MLRSLLARPWLWILLTMLGTVSSAGILSIAGMDGFSEARGCVAEAFHLYSGGGLWNGALQCSSDNGGYKDACVCRCDLRTIGESYISSYVKSACSSNNVDIQSGLLLYDAYCASALPDPCPGYTPVSVQVTLPTKAPGVLSIWSADAFASARSCMTEAFHPYNGGGLWNGALQCVDGTSGYLNQCVCRADLLPIGESYISSYVKSACSSNTADIQSGLSLYDNYCATAYPKAAQITGVGVVQALGTTTSGLFTPAKTSSLSASSSAASSTKDLTSSTGRSQTLASTGNSVAGTSSTDTSQISSSTDGSVGSGQSRRLSQSDVIALGVGIGVGVPATIAGLITCCYTIRRP